MAILPLPGGHKCIRSTATITATVWVGIGGTSCDGTGMLCSVFVRSPHGLAYANCADTDFAGRVTRYTANLTCQEGTRTSQGSQSGSLSGQTFTFSGITLSDVAGSLPCRPTSATVTGTI
jgi:hypothetical protein